MKRVWVEKTEKTFEQYLTKIHRASICEDWLKAGDCGNEEWKIGRILR